jgi:tRNA threonylcarbamoyladenosine biosynthesis protein TsaE
MHWKLTTYSEDETRAAGRKLAEQLPPTAIVAMSGDLGAGKTAFIRGVCEFFGCASQVSSPTFTIVHEYDGTRSIAHCDLYRLESTEEMLQIGLDQLFREERVILIEWAERALPLLPLPRFEVAARHTDSSEIRELEIMLLEADDSTSILFEPQQLFRRVS